MVSTGNGELEHLVPKYYWRKAVASLSDPKFALGRVGNIPGCGELLLGL
jgi:hypothetical protein